MSDESLDNIIRVDFGGGTPQGEPQTDVSELEADVSAEQSEEKVRIFSELLDRGTVMVTLDSRRDDVTIPDDFRDEFRLNLNFCYQFAIPDFEFDDVGIRASLSFGGVDYWCDIGWDAVYMLRSHVENDVVLFPNDFPPEMVALLPPRED